jgi:hypothetical protein
MEVNAQPKSKLDSLINDSEFNRFGLICVILTVVGCLGGIAVGLGAVNYTITLIAAVVPTMMTLSLLIAVAPMRYIITTALISVIIDVIMIAFFALT